jgi:acetylornithine deacetylase
MERAFKTLLDWIAIPSLTGEEGSYGDALAREFAALGLDIERQQLAPGRFNVLARADAPEVVFCTHLDTVPPFYGPRAEAGWIHGRGACDAKGQALAMLGAARALLEQGERRFGLLFTVGEETDSAGAALANARLADPWRPRHVIVGEPTGNRFVRAGKGTFKGKLVARGVAGHSSEDLGPSAVHELVHCAHRLLSESWGEHPLLGAGTLNIGVLHGGVAANVVADEATADVLIRTVEPLSDVRARLERCLGPHVRVAENSKGYAPVEFGVPVGEEGIMIAFGTDAPHMPRWGSPLLYGPGSIQDAHTDHEKVKQSDIELATARHVKTARELLARSHA